MTDEKRPSRWPWIATALAMLVSAAGGGALAAYLLFRRIDLHLLLTEQPAKVTIVEPMNVTAKVLEKLDIAIDQTIHAKVPIDQMVSLNITDTLRVIAEFDSEIPIELSVRVRESIPLDQVLEVDAVVEAEFLGDRHQLPLRGKIPVKASVPIDLTIPVKQNVRLKFTAPVRAKLQQALQAPLRTVIEADIPLRSELSVPVRSNLVAEVTFPKEPTNVVLDYADLRLPLSTLTLGWDDGGS